MDDKPRLAEVLSPQVLREYALLVVGERGVVMGPRGECGWMCLPRWDSPAVFGSLLGGAGTYIVSPRIRGSCGVALYEARSLIWRSRWSAGSTRG